MNNYTYVSIIALYCYIFLFISLSASKKTKLIKAFMTLLMAMMFWTGGSFFMRSMFGPSVKFWYDISLLVLSMNFYLIHPIKKILFGSFFLSDFSLLMLQQNSCCQHLNIQ